MTYSIEWDEAAIKFLKQLEKDTAERILNKLEQIKENPFRYFEHYEGEHYKLRIGDYRLLVDVNFDRKILTIQLLDKRARIYKR
ncbi:type II toxin-antitoxin system RelE/ParE family toxin [Candidatus Pacearchaeota archaeon]|nr:type II toxin-antitoxin system RelE/ParE family toxin [Candidatus Pacearchaeota archaeon]